jgi:hypothetical protein
MFEYARRRRRMRVNPIGLLEPLSVPMPDTPVLREEEVTALQRPGSHGRSGRGTTSDARR